MHCRQEILISIRPEYSEQLLDGKKSVELRRRPVRVPPGTRVWIYSTLPVGRLDAVAEVEAVYEWSPSEIWDQYGHVSGVTQSALESYFSGVDQGCVVVFKRVVPIHRPLSLGLMRKRLGNFNPPQFFKRLDHDSPELNLFCAAMARCDLSAINPECGVDGRGRRLS
ncbi:MAG: ASCH domain-containing protein [Bryobacteraceae bacterium]